MWIFRLEKMLDHYESRAEVAEVQAEDTAEEKPEDVGGCEAIDREQSFVFLDAVSYMLNIISWVRNTKLT